MNKQVLIWRDKEGKEVLALPLKQISVATYYEFTWRYGTPIGKTIEI